MLLLQADEYVVYSAHQQRMRDLVEFSLPEEESVAGEEASESGEGGLGGETQVAEEDTEPEASEGEGGGDASKVLVSACVILSFW